MPTYEYECKACQERVEFFQAMSEAPKRKCPACGTPRGLKRLISAGAGIIFKGSGFYETDYRSAEYKKQAKEEAKAAEPSKPDSSESKSETSKPGKSKSETSSSKGSSGESVAKPSQSKKDA